MPSTIPPVKFLPPPIQNDDEATDLDVIQMRYESVCPVAEWLKGVAA